MRAWRCRRREDRKRVARSCRALRGTGGRGRRGENRREAATPRDTAACPGESDHQPPRPRSREGRVPATASCKAQLLRQAVEVRRVYAGSAQGSQDRHDLGPGAVDTPVTKLANHAREPVLVLIMVELSRRPLMAKLFQLLRDARGTDRLELPVLFVGRHCPSSPESLVSCTLAGRGPPRQPSADAALGRSGAPRFVGLLVSHAGAK